MTLTRTPQRPGDVAVTLYRYAIDEEGGVTLNAQEWAHRPGVGYGVYEEHDGRLFFRSLWGEYYIQDHPLVAGRPQRAPATSLSEALRRFRHNLAIDRDLADDALDSAQRRFRAVERAITWSEKEAV